MEINQPLAAIRNFLAWTRVFAERGDFARKSTGGREAVAIDRVLDHALVLVEPRLSRDGVEFVPKTRRKA